MSVAIDENPAVPKNGHARSPLSVLVISHMYPTPQDRVVGCFVEEQVRALAEVGVACTVVSPQPIHPLRRFVKARLFSEKNGVDPRVHRPVYLTPRGLLSGARVATFVESCVRAVDAMGAARFDLIHAHTALMDGTAGAYLASRFRAPLVITEHMGPFSLLTNTAGKRFVTKNAYARATRIIAVSRFLAKEIEGLVGDEIAGRISVIGNGYESSIFKPDPLAVPPSKRSARYLLFVGYFDPLKRVDVLLAAFSRIAAVHSELELHLVGGSKGPSDVPERVRALPESIARRVHVHGLVDRETVALYMQQRCDVLVLPSAYETFGVVVIEALAAGKPVVATRCGGPEDTVSAEVGELVPVDDPAALADALVRVLANLDRYEPSRLIRYVEERFSYAEIAAKVRAVYDDALGG
jgi:glycosyltransferase involved in cell wall biosynthesis